MRFALPVAACLAFAIVLTGVFSLTGGGNDENGTPSAPVFGNFTVQAYALDANTAIAPSADQLIVFSRTAALNGMLSKADYLQPSGGYYTGSLFGVQGQNITRLQASISTGVIYRCDAEKIVRGDDLDRWRELISWKPHARGTGSYFNNYDYVETFATADGLPKDSPEKSLTVVMNKKLGSTIDVPITDELANYRFGFWTNEDYSDSDAANSTDAVLDLFDGATLTVTATFADGATTTQVIELKAGNVRSTTTQDENGAWTQDVVPELIDAQTTAKLTPNQEYAHVLYGKVVETNGGAFPGSLENANELADKVDAGPTFEKRDLMRPDMLANGKRATTSDFSVQEPGASFKIGQTGFFNVLTDAYEEKPVALLMSGLTGTRSKTLPAGISLNDLDGGIDNWDYFNKVVGEMDGFTLDTQGTPSDGFSWLLMEATVTNASDQQFEVFGRAFADMHISDAGGLVSTVACRDFGLKGGDLGGASQPLYARYAFAAQESQAVRWLVIVPDSVLDDPTLFFSAPYLETDGLQGCKVAINAIN